MARAGESNQGSSQATGNSGDGDASGDGMRQLLQAKLQQRLGNREASPQQMHPLHPLQQMPQQQVPMPQYAQAPTPPGAGGGAGGGSPLGFHIPQIQMPHELNMGLPTHGMLQPPSPMIQVTTPTTSGSNQVTHWMVIPNSPGSTLGLGTPGAHQGLWNQPLGQLGGWSGLDGRLAPTGFTPASSQMLPGNQLWAQTPAFGGLHWE